MNSDIRIPRAAWIALGLIFTVNLLNYIDRQILYAVLPLIKIDLSLTDTQLGELASAFMIIYMFAAPVIALLADRLGRKKWMVGGIFAWSAATVFSGVSTSFAQLFSSRAAVGVGESSFGSISPSFIAEHFPSTYRARALGIFAMAVPVGSALGYVLGGMVGNAYGWRPAFLGAGLLGIPLGFIVARLKDPRAAAPVGPKVLLGPVYRKLFKTPSFMFASLGMAFMTFALGGLAVWMPTFLTRHWSMSLSHAGLIFGGMTVVAGTCGSLAGGWISDRLLAKNPSAYFLVGGCGLLVALPLGILGMMQSTVSAALIFIGLAEFFAFLHSGPLNAIITEVTPLEARTMAFAANIFIIHALGDAVSPIIIGVISDRTQLSTALILAMLPLGIGGLLCLAGMKTYTKDRVES